MSAAGGRTAASAANASVGTNPWLIAVLVAFAAFMEVLDTTIANERCRISPAALR
jgi:MFS transporter, DHA2 family, multidrug resistance protein